MRNATPRTRVTFRIEVVNADVNDLDGDGDTTEACSAAGTCGIFIDVVADGSTVISPHRMEIIIP